MFDSYAVTFPRQHRICHIPVPAGHRAHLSEKDLQLLPNQSFCSPPSTMHTMRPGILLFWKLQRAPRTPVSCSSQPGLPGFAGFGGMQAQCRHHQCPAYVLGGHRLAAPTNMHSAARHVLYMQRSHHARGFACLHAGQPANVTQTCEGAIIAAACAGPNMWTHADFMVLQDHSGDFPAEDCQSWLMALRSLEESLQKAEWPGRTPSAAELLTWVGRILANNFGQACFPYNISAMCPGGCTVDHSRAHALQALPEERIH